MDKFLLPWSPDPPQFYPNTDLEEQVAEDPQFLDDVVWLTAMEEALNVIIGEWAQMLETGVYARADHSGAAATDLERLMNMIELVRQTRARRLSDVSDR